MKFTLDCLLQQCAITVNRKMEQSANRKRKGLTKTHRSWSWQYPATERRRMLSWEEHQLCTGPQALSSTEQLRQTQAEVPRGSIFHWEAQFWLPWHINLLSFLLRKTEQLFKIHSHESFLLANKSQIHQEKPRWGLTSEPSQVQQWHSPPFSTQRQQNLGSAPHSGKRQRHPIPEKLAILVVWLQLGAPFAAGAGLRCPHQLWVRAVLPVTIPPRQDFSLWQSQDLESQSLVLTSLQSQVYTSPTQETMS